MPRLGALLALSREHHGSLVLARDVRRMLEANESPPAGEVAAALAAVEAHWRAVLVAHFEREEALIDVAQATLDPHAVRRVLAEHAELRALAMGACGLDPAARLQRFAELISGHVRFEERVLFPQLQRHPCVVGANAGP